ncbi:hypothetical protein AUJ65_04025 [Candidatus Micrarchaeota archaeon CG1_02_51_15]|nr:MAG: hypothetical protein AUJ65_04025 [Candidatus Micrarchaeota archaeon CG1_02_51_15]
MGLKLPKLAVVEHDGNPVLVSEAFSFRGKSKIKPLNVVDFGSLSDKHKAEIQDTLVKMVNAGYMPHEDLFGHIRRMKAGGAYPALFGDLDALLPDMQSKHWEGALPQNLDWFFQDLYPNVRERKSKWIDFVSKVRRPVGKAAIDRLGSKLDWMT